MNGVPIGMTPITTATLPNEIRKGPPMLAAEPREVDPGGTRSRSPAQRRDRVFRQSSDTPITVSDLRDPQTHKTDLTHFSRRIRGTCNATPCSQQEASNYLKLQQLARDHLTQSRLACIERSSIVHNYLKEKELCRQPYKHGFLALYPKGGEIMRVRASNCVLAAF